MKCTPELITKHKIYTPMAYSKEDSSLAPLVGGKATATTIIEDQHGHGMMNNPSTLMNTKVDEPQFLVFQR